MASFIVVNVVLAIINLLTGNGELWFYWITAFWGIGLIGHFVKVFIVNGRLEDNREDMIQKEMEKMKK